MIKYNTATIKDNYGAVILLHKVVCRISDAESAKTVEYVVAHKGRRDEKALD
jgi:hypothetical protein